MTEQPVQEPEMLTPEQMRIKRQAAAIRLMFNYVAKNDAGERDLYALNLAKDMGESERMMLVELLLSTFPPDLSELAVKAFFEDAGMPTIALMGDPSADAKFWADGANAAELKAYAIACYRRMSKGVRKSFVEWAQKGVNQ